MGKISKHGEIYRLENKITSLLLEEDLQSDSFGKVEYCSRTRDHVICHIPFDLCKLYKINKNISGISQKMLWSWMEDCIVREDLLRGMELQGFSGYRTTKVALFNKQGKRIDLDAYNRLIVTGWGGCAPGESGIKELSRCPGCGRLKYNSYTKPEHLFDVVQWDGSDFFMIWPLPKYIFVTARVVQYLKNEKIDNFRAVNICKLEMDPIIKEIDNTLSPGRLSDYMPKELAEKYGKKLNID